MEETDSAQLFRVFSGEGQGNIPAHAMPDQDCFGYSLFVKEVFDVVSHGFDGGSPRKKCRVLTAAGQIGSKDGMIFFQPVDLGCPDAVVFAEAVKEHDGGAGWVIHALFCFL